MKLNDLSEAAGRPFTERANESYRLVGAFCPWLPQRRGRQEDEAQARVGEERRRGAPLLRPKGRLAQSIQTKSRRASSTAFLGGLSSSFSSRTKGTFASRGER